MTGERADRAGSEFCLVTGATGAVGPSLVQGLAARGHRVRALARRPVPPGALPQGMEVCCGDIRNPETVQRAVEGVSIVFHLAAMLHIAQPSPDLRSEYWQVNTEGTRNVVNACVQCGVSRLVFFSTASVYGSTPGGIADEDTPPRGVTLYAETKREAEKLVLAARHRDSGQPLGVVLRLAAVYGPRMKGNYVRLVEGLASGWFVPVGDGSNRRTLVYEDDVVRAALLAACHPVAPGRIYNVSDGSIHTLREVIAAICSALGRRPPRLYLPIPPARWAVRAADLVLSVGGHPMRFSPMIEKLVEDVAVRADRIQTELGFHPDVKLGEGWKGVIKSSKRSSGAVSVAA